MAGRSFVLSCFTRYLPWSVVSDLATYSMAWETSLLRSLPVNGYSQTYGGLFLKLTAHVLLREVDLACLKRRKEDLTCLGY